MKKIFSLFAAVLFAGSMMAAEVEVTKSVHDLFPDDANGTQEATLYADEVLTISVNADGNNGKIYGSGTEWRLYQTNNAVITVSAVDATIKTVQFTYTVGNTGVLTFNNATLESETDAIVNAESAQFEVANSGSATNGQVKVSAFKVVYDAAAIAVSTPVIAGEDEFENEVEVSITCATEDAEIYYTLDGSAPTAEATKYTAAFKLTETATVKAIAIKGEDKSSVVEKTFTKLVPLSLTEFIANKPATEAPLKDLTVIFASGKNTYVIDEDGVALVIYDAGKTYYDGTLTAGKVLSGQKATYAIYNNQDEIVPTNTAEVSDGVAPVPTLMNAAPTTADVNKFVRLEDVEAVETGSKYYIYGDVQLYGATSALLPTADGKYDVEGIVVNYKGTQLELIVTAIAESAATAIDNTAVEAKSVKFFENGQLLIMKNGVVYNAQGAVVR